MSAPLSSLEASILQIVTTVVGLIVGLGVLSSTEGQVIVSSAGVIAGAVVQIGNSIYALAHAKQTAALHA